MALQEEHTTTVDVVHPFSEADIGVTQLTPTYRMDLRPDGPDVFHDANPVNDWSELTWEKIGRPYRVKRW